MQYHSDKKKKSNKYFYFLLCIPLILITVLIIVYSNRDDVLLDVTSLEIEYTDGKTETVDSQETIDFYTDMLLNAEHISEKLRDLSNESPIVLKFKTKDNGDEIVYKLYLELNLKGCLAALPDGSFSVIRQSDAEKLLLSDSCVYLYSDIRFPTLTLCNNDERTLIIPSQCGWNYKRIDGVYVPDNPVTTEVQSRFDIGNTATRSFEFSITPSDYAVTYKLPDGSTVDSNDISTLTFFQDTLLTAVITANWNESADGKYYGTAEYSFKLLYDCPTTFQLADNVLNAGDFTYFSLNNYTPGEDINLITSLFTSQLKPFEYNDKYYAWLPISPETGAGVYSVFVSCRDNQQEFQITVNELNSELKRVSIPTDIYDSEMNISVMQEFVNSLSDKSIDIAIYDTSVPFALPVETDVIMNFGTLLLVNDTPPNLIHAGIDYSSDDQPVPVKASEGGKIVFIGKVSGLGNVIVIEHGFGLQTYYAHLSDIVKVAVGDVIRQGTEMGTIGTSGVCATPSLHFAAAINGVFINPDILLTEGCKLPST